LHYFTLHVNQGKVFHITCEKYAMKKISYTIILSDEVTTALAENNPVVTLESTVISLGLPYPENLHTAFECETIIRREGATPATVGIVDGALKIGLSAKELESFATRKDIIKTNLSNLAPTCAAKRWGATSVSVSLLATAMAGIDVFVTGGIGGIHRTFKQNLDISSDLTALSRYRAIIVSAGVKSLLNVAATRECLETLGIPILGYRTDFFPAFYTPSSPYHVDRRVETPEEVAVVYQIQKDMGLPSSILVAVPVPEKEGIPAEELEHVLRELEDVLQREPVPSGRDVTPYILRQLNERMNGRCLAANLALLKNNAAIGAQIACSLKTCGKP
jgi:pseudouridine-5'-phosphate glycosidase